MKKDVLDFFTKKKEFLSNLKIKYSGKQFAGSGSIPAIYTDIEAICKTIDTSTIFNEIINRKDSLEKNAEILEQLEAFYKEGSSQQKVYNDALEIVRWYNDNYSLFNGLESIEPVIDEMGSILNMAVPFVKMTQLSSLVFQANQIKDQIIEEKYNNAIRSINNDKEEINKELDAALESSISDRKKYKIQDKFDEIERVYTTWNNSMSKKTPNLDAYVLSSQNTVKDFKKYIQKILSEVELPTDTGDTVPPVTQYVKRKTVKVINCIPTAKKTIKSKEEIESILDYIKAELEKAFDNNDEINLE